MIKMPKKRKNDHTQSHHQWALAITIVRAIPMTIHHKIDEMIIVLVKSMSHKRNVMVLIPYLFSILKFLYRLKGISKKVST